MSDLGKSLLEKFNNAGKNLRDSVLEVVERVESNVYHFKNPEKLNDSKCRCTFKFVRENDKWPFKVVDIPCDKASLDTQLTMRTFTVCEHCKKTKLSKENVPLSAILTSLDDENGEIAIDVADTMKLKELKNETT